MGERRPSLRGLLGLGACLGAFVGTAEVALRASPRLGMDVGGALRWLALSVVLYVAYLLAAAVVAWAIGRRSRGLIVAAAVVVQAALYYRFDLFLNEFFTDPVVWGGLSAIGLGCLLLGVLLDPWIARGERLLGRTALAAAVVAAGLAVLRVGEADHPTRAPADRPNVVIITLDTTRPDQLSPYGANNDTPTLARLAREGVLFTEAVATAPLTEPSHLAILTGIPPYISGVVSNGTALGDRPALISHTLQAEGYATAGFVSGFPLHGRYGWAQGFAVYDDDFGQVQGLHRLSLVKAWDQVVLPAHTLRERRGDLTTRRALRWLDDHGDERIFLWLHLFDPHAPYEAPDHPFDPPTDGSALALPPYWPPPHRAITSTDWLEEAYRAELRYVDGLLGQVVASLEAQGVLDDTLLIVTADHGESLTEHDYLFDHGDDLFDPSLRVPLIVRYPRAAVAGTRVAGQVSNLDITPTILSLLGLAETDVQRRYGIDRSAALAGGESAPGAVVATTVGGRFMADPPLDHALRADGHKLIRRGGDGSEACYDLRDDPGELGPLGAGCPETLGSMLQLALESGGEVASPELDPATLEALRALGYVE